MEASRRIATHTQPFQLSIACGLGGGGLRHAFAGVFDLGHREQIASGDLYINN
jgi:hypothetical protein